MQQAGVKRVRDWLEELLPDDEKDEDDGGAAPPGKETSVIVNQLACKEAGCPDVEVVITLLRAKPRPKLMFKIFKAAAELTNDEVEASLRKALAEEEGGQEHAHDHKVADAAVVTQEHGHVEGHEHGHGDGADCCGHEHDEHGHGHAEEHEHGHEK